MNSNKKSMSLRLRALCEGAVMVALAQVLSFLKLYELPQGGSVCIGMLPLFLYCIRWGWKNGFLASLAFGLLQLIFDGAYAWGPWSMLLDYVLAFTVLGISGFFCGRRGGIYLGTVMGCLARFVCHFVSGITIYRIYEPVELFDHAFTNPYIYSAAYNGSFILIDMAVCVIIFALLSRPMRGFYRSQLKG